MSLTLATPIAPVPPLISELITEVVNDLTRDPTATSQVIGPTVQPTVATTLASAISDVTELTALTMAELNPVAITTATSSGIVLPNTGTAFVFGRVQTVTVINSTIFNSSTITTRGRSANSSIVLIGAASGGFMTFNSSSDASKRIMGVMTFPNVTFTSLNNGGQISYIVPTGSSSAEGGRAVVGHGTIELNTDAFDKKFVFSASFPSDQETNYGFQRIRPTVGIDTSAALTTVQQ